MQMNDTEIRKYASLMAELGLTALEITDENHKTFRLERAVPTAVPTVVSVPQEAAVPKREESFAQSGGTGSAVLSPMVGVFYSAPAENAEPFVKVGDTVKKGSVLCIIEAMKLMNEITAEEDGVITEICVKNGQAVDYGCPLFKLARG